MRLICFRFIIVFVFIFPVFSLSGCFSTLQTAKTSNGFSFTSGLYTYTTEKHSYLKSHYEDHYLLILMPRCGRAATERKVGLDFGLRIISDVIDSYDGENPFLIFGEEFKVQIPRNRYPDLAFGVDFYFIYPVSVFILGSKDLSKTFSLYGGGEIFGGLYNIILTENETGFYPKLTLGSEINLSNHVSTLVEVENWFNTGWTPRENIRFAIGMKVCPAK